MALLTERLTSHQRASCSSMLPTRPGCHSCTPVLYPAVALRSMRPRHAAGAPRASALVTRSAAPDQQGSAVPPAASVRGVETSKACLPCLDGAVQVEIMEHQVITKFIAETLLPTRHGMFRLRGYKHSIDNGVTFTEPTAIICGEVEGKEDVPVRVHDACFTSEVLGSLKCDCAEQLALTLELIHKNPPGMVIYLQQEGRGIGLANKIAAYSLQEQGLDTVDANRALGLPDDCREYTSVRNIIKDLGIKSIQLITNNPRKISELEKMGINITGRVPCVVQAGQYNQGYLETKRERMDHMLEGQVSASSDSDSDSNSPVSYSSPLPSQLIRVPLGLARDVRGGVPDTHNNILTLTM